MPNDSSGNYQNFVSYSGTAVASGADGAAPSTTAHGMDISDASGFRFIVSAASGQTLTSYTARVWLYSNSLARWVHNAQLDYTPTLTSATWRDDVSPDFVCPFGYGRAYVQLIAATVSSGSATPQGEAGVLK